MKKHFVVFRSPGTFVAEETVKEIAAWEVDVAVEMAHSITQRYNATPYGFMFITRERKDDELDSSVVARSGMYFLGGKIETADQVNARNDPDEKILRDNMKHNEIDKVIINENSFKITLPFTEKDTLLEFTTKNKA